MREATLLMDAGNKNNMKLDFLDEKMVKFVNYKVSKI